jgi:hypothetical protein
MIRQNTHTVAITRLKVSKVKSPSMLGVSVQIAAITRFYPVSLSPIPLGYHGGI